ncbi:MAG: ISAzo13 family transposase [Bacteroidota bacterium]
MKQIEAKISKLLPILTEKQRRLYLSSEAEALGRGGITLISKISKMSRPTITEGIKELNQGIQNIDLNRIRTEGGGRKKITDKSPALLSDLESLVSPLTRGDPESALRWTIKSTRVLADELKHFGHNISHTKVSMLLSELGYSLQANAKRIEGNQHPDRNAQFLYINDKIEARLSEELPAISVDTKKKELIGNYKNAGREYRPKYEPRGVEVHDFGKERAAPYGVYDIGQNEGFVNVGKSFDTATFAVNSIRQWWLLMGKNKYENADKLLITADGGGSNGYRIKLWKKELQNFANETKMEITVCHFPPGTSKWNKIEHRLFSFISLNWRGVPLESYETVVQLIGAVKTSKGLVVKSRLDENIYEKGKIVSKIEMDNLDIQKHDFHEEWNYTIRPIL